MMCAAWECTGSISHVIAYWMLGSMLIVSLVQCLNGWQSAFRGWLTWDPAGRSRTLTTRATLQIARSPSPILYEQSCIVLSFTHLR